MQKYQNTVLDTRGRPVSGATVTVTTTGGVATTIYSDNGSTTITNLTTGADGSFAFYAADGRYNIQITKTGLTTKTITDVLLDDSDSGGGSISLEASDGASQVGFIASGSGATARTVEAKLREFPSVEDRGTAGDCVVDRNRTVDANGTDDTTALNAALSAAATRGGGVVTTKPNTLYRTTSVVTVPTGVSLQMGDGSAIVADHAGVAVLIQPDAPDGDAEDYVFTQHERRNIIRVVKKTIAWHDSAGNADTTSVGIKVVNARYSTFDLSANGFYVNYKLCGYDSDPDTAETYSAGGAHQGCVYTLRSRNAKTHVLLAENGATGYVNQNTWIGGYMRNDSSYVASNRVGWDATIGDSNGWCFVGVNVEGANWTYAMVFGSPKNTLLGVRFEAATAGMVKVLSGGGIAVLPGYVGGVEDLLFDVDAGGTFVWLNESSSWFTNGIPSKACVNARLTNTTNGGFFQRHLTADRTKIYSEVEGSGTFYHWDWYGPTGKYHATDNPTGLTNPTLRFDLDARSLRFRGSTDDTANDATIPQWSWATANSFSIFRQTWHWENCDYNRSLRLGASVRFWSDTNGVPRVKNGAPSSTTDGLSLPTVSGSATYDPGSLADGAGVTTTVTATGASLGDFAQASFSLDLQGITVSAWVSAADTVSVRFQNESGGVVDLASGTLRVRVSKV